MIPPAYKYQITMGGFQRWVYPVDADKLKYTWAQENGQIFFRKKLTSKLVFINDGKNGVDDFTFFKDVELSPVQCDEIKIEIFKYCQGAYNSDWKGYFSTSIGFFDFDECRFEVTPLPDDLYRCILAKFNNEVNILDVPNVITSQADLDVGIAFEYHYCRQNVSSDCDAGGCTPGLPTPASSWQILHKATDFDPNGNYICIYFRERVTTSCQAGIPASPAGSGWTLLNDDCAGSNTSDFVRQPAAPLANNPNPDVQQGLCVSGVAQPPPTKIKKDIELTDPIGGPTVNIYDVKGWDGVSSSAITPKDVKYQVEVATSSTLNWFTNGGGATTIILGQGTDTVVIRWAYNNPTLAPVPFLVTCEEITAGGDTIHHRIDITHYVYQTGAPAGPYMDGPVNICITQQDIIFEIPEIFRTSAVFTGAWNFNSSHYELVLDEGWRVHLRGKGIEALSSNVYFLYNVTTPCGLRSLLVSKLTVLSKNPVTDPIQGLTPIEVNSTGCRYRVSNRQGSTYDWEVTGGSIVSGNGTNEVVVHWDVTSGTFLITVKETSSCGCSWQLLVDCEVGNETPYYWCTQAAFNTTYRNTRSLMEVMEYMISQLGCPEYTGQIMSDILDWRAPGTTTGYAPGILYADGGINDYSNILISQKSDIKFPTSSNPATVGKWTLKKALEKFANLKIYWYIDEVGNLRLEYTTHFTFPDGLDLTQSKYVNSMKRSNKYNHDASQIPKYERFRWMEQLFEDFVGTEILYDSNCVNQDPDNNIVTHEMPDVTTDLNYIATLTEEISSDGFVWLAADANNNVINRIGPLSGDSLANMPLSWAMIHERFYHNEMYLKQGTVNNSFRTFDTFRPNIQQNPVQVQLCCDVFLPENNVLTELGTILGGLKGRVVSADYLFSTQSLVLKIAYSYANI